MDSQVQMGGCQIVVRPVSSLLFGKPELWSHGFRKMQGVVAIEINFSRLETFLLMVVKYVLSLLLDQDWLISYKPTMTLTNNHGAELI